MSLRRGTERVVGLDGPRDDGDENNSKTIQCMVACVGNWDEVGSATNLRYCVWALTVLGISGKLSNVLRKRM